MRIDDLLVSLIIIGFIFVMLFFWGRIIQRWDVKVAIDDGMTIRYVNARIKGRVKPEEVKKKDMEKAEIYYLVEYKDPLTKRTVEVIVPDKPGYTRLMRFWLGLVKSQVFRVDTSGVAMPWEVKTAYTVDAKEIEYIKTHEMIWNTLRSKAILDKYLLYMAVVIIAVVVLAGVVVWRITSMPHEIVIQVMNQTSKPSIPPPG